MSESVRVKEWESERDSKWEREMEDGKGKKMTEIHHNRENVTKLKIEQTMTTKTYLLRF